MKEFLLKEKKYIEETASKLKALNDSGIFEKPNGKWSAKEIIGHLIDSASNNHQRFIRAQFTDDLIFPGYGQDEWVNVQDYQNGDWQTLIELWKSFNLHLVFAIDKIPDNILKKERVNHNLYEIAAAEFVKEKPVTLEEFIKDYYSHLRHHITQLFKQAGE